MIIKCSEKEEKILKRYIEDYDCLGVSCSECDFYSESQELGSRCGIALSNIKFEITNQSEPKLVYISGKITGDDDYLDKFKTAEDKLISLGYEVINPAKILSYLPKYTPYDTYMNMSYEMLKTCDAIYMMEGWEESKGARLELDFAKEHEIKEFKLKESFEVRNKKEYNIVISDCRNSGTLRIMPNSKTYTNREYSDSIYFSVSNDDAYDEKTLFYGLTKQQAKEIIDALSEVLETIEEGEN